MTLGHFAYTAFSLVTVSGLLSLNPFGLQSCRSVLLAASHFNQLLSQLGHCELTPGYLRVIQLVLKQAGLYPMGVAGCEDCGIWMSPLQCKSLSGAGGSSAPTESALPQSAVR